MNGATCPITLHHKWRLIRSPKTKEPAILQALENIVCTAYITDNGTLTLVMSHCTFRL